MKVGFTGTQRGMSEFQRISFEAGLRFMFEPDSEFHHGDCIGADEQAQSIAMRLGFIIHIYPPIDPKKRAFCNGPHIMVPKPYLERNHDIVDATDILIATPGEAIEQLRSGTWATIRYARKKNRKLLIIGPAGEPL